MKFRTFTLFILALSLAGGAAWFANQWIRLQVKPASADATPMSYIVVAAQTIPLGQKIIDTHLELASWPAELVPVESFAEVEGVKGQVAAQTIYKGEPILQKKIAEHAKGSTLSALIAPSKRAVSVRVNDVVGVAGFVLPGNTVDVLATLNNRGKKDEARVKTVLQNVKVLAVDQTTGSNDEPVVVRAVTLELAPDEAEELVKSRSEGSIQLTLRNTLDNEVTEAPEPEPAPAPVAKPKPQPKKTQVSYITVIRGTSVSEVRQP